MASFIGLQAKGLCILQKLANSGEALFLWTEEGNWTKSREREKKESLLENLRIAIARFDDLCSNQLSRI